MGLLMTRAALSILTPPPSTLLSFQPPVWGFSFLSVTVINAFSLTGVFIVPLMKTRYMKYALAFFIALAIGTLFSNAVLQLLPEVCHPSAHTHTFPR